MTDMTFNEGVSILGFVCGLFFCLFAWTVLGSIGVEFSNRVMGTMIALLAAAGPIGIVIIVLFVIVLKRSP
ncbi:MAG: hypothetical protein RTU63_14070 [Candidatus Thorarchaeota archaeon]